MRTEIFLKYNRTDNGMAIVYYKFDSANDGFQYSPNWGIKDDIDGIVISPIDNGEMLTQMEIDNQHQSMVFYPELPMGNTETDKNIREYLLKIHPLYEPYKKYIESQKHV